MEIIFDCSVGFKVVSKGILVNLISKLIFAQVFIPELNFISQTYQVVQILLAKAEERHAGSLGYVFPILVSMALLNFLILVEWEDSKHFLSLNLSA